MSAVGIVELMATDEDAYKLWTKALARVIQYVAQQHCDYFAFVIDIDFIGRRKKYKRIRIQLT